MLISRTVYTVPIVIGNTDFHRGFLPRKEYAILALQSKKKTPNQFLLFGRFYYVSKLVFATNLIRLFYL